MVGLRRFRSSIKEPRVERLGSGNGPVLVNLVLDFHADFIVLTPLARSAELGLLRQLVGNAGFEHHRLSLDANELVALLGVCLLLFAISNGGLEGVADIVLELLVATEHDKSASHISTSPVEGLGVVLWLVHELRHDLIHAHLRVSLHGHTKVELIGHLQVNLGLKGDLFFLVVLKRKL